MIYQNPINRDDIVSLINYLEEKDITCVFAELNKMYINKQTNGAIEAMKACNAFVPPVEPMKQALKNPIYQVVPFITLEEETRIMQYMPNCQMTRWCDKAVDINPRHGGKGRGIAKMLSYWNIKKEDVMAFGDGENDIDMLEKAGIGVAMQNAEEAVKRAADQVTNAPGYEGIKNMLRKYKVL
jgi:Cof subfamily protein (haloacid dehalogenase superfamily)